MDVLPSEFVQQHRDGYWYIRNHSRDSGRMSIRPGRDDKDWYKTDPAFQNFLWGIGRPETDVWYREWHAENPTPPPSPGPGGLHDVESPPTPPDMSFIMEPPESVISELDLDMSAEREEPPPWWEAGPEERFKLAEHRMDHALEWVLGLE